MLRNYLIPLPPPAQTSLASFMADHMTDSQGLDAGEWKYELRKMDPRDLKMYEAQLRQFNAALEQHRAEHMESIKGPVLGLPDYYNMLLARAELGFEYE